MNLFGISNKQQKCSIGTLTVTTVLTVFWWVDLPCCPADSMISVYQNDDDDDDDYIGTQVR